MKTYAIISDIHGNSRALQAVLDDIRARGIKSIINLGDHVFGALEPELTAAMLRENDMISIYGNKDRDILESLDKPTPDQTMEQVKAAISAETIAWLQGLKPTVIVDQLFFACHGTPESDNEYLLEKVSKSGVSIFSDEELMAKTAHISEKIILCGHSHVSRVVYLSNGKIILNPGSVGLPAYLSNKPFDFVMESMSPYAKYAIVQQTDEHLIHIEQVSCEYNWHAASATAGEHGRQDWSSWLLSGRAPLSNQ